MKYKQITKTRQQKEKKNMWKMKNDEGGFL